MLPVLFLTGIILAQIANVLIEKEIRNKVIYTNFSKKMLDGHKDTVKTAVEIEAIVLGEKLKGLTRDQQIAAIIAETDQVRFFANKSGYFFVYDTRGVRINVPIDKSRNGKNLITLTDEKGVPYVRDIVNAGKNGGGFMSYLFKKEGHGLQPKQSYATLIPGTDFVIGCGAYIDDVQSETQALQNSIRASDRAYKIYLYLVLSGIIVTTLIAVIVLATSINNAFRDQSEKQRLQAQLALSAKLQAIGQLAAGVAHEINTPMQFISDNAEFLRKSFADISKLIESYQRLERECDQSGDYPEVLSQVKETRSETDSEFLIREIPSACDETISGIERVTKLVQAMKTFSQQTQGKMQPCDLNKSIEATVSVCRNEWKNVADMELDFDTTLPLVHCLMDELNQVILNMIANSIDAIKDAIKAGRYEKGTISVTTRKIDDNACIVITDNGMGIPESIAQKIFDPFFTTKELGKGTGQGLAISHDIIANKHNGQIEVESEVGKGTQFTLTIPIKALVAC